jgi:phage baseplate assembly protein W
MPSIDQVLGFGLIHPLRFDGKSDFAAAGGLALVRSAVTQILGTRRGELLWRMNFGALLDSLRHMPNNIPTQELARAWIVDALGRWEPRVMVKAVAFEIRDSEDGRRRNVLYIKITYDVLASPRPGNAVLARDVVQYVEVGETGTGGGMGVGG